MPKKTKHSHRKDSVKHAHRSKPAVDELSEGGSEQSERLAWEAPTFTYYKKDWLWTVGLLAAAGIFIVIFYLMEDYSAMLVVALATFVLYQQAQERPSRIRYSVDELGVHVGAEHYPWVELKSFWITGQPGSYHLYLETTARWLPIRTIHLAHVEPAELRSRLARYLPEHTTRGEALTDLVIRWLRL